MLSRYGYDATSATVAEAEILLCTKGFDLVIVSAFLSQPEKDRVISAAGETPTLVLEGLTLAPELLVEVDRRLASVSKEP